MGSFNLKIHQTSFLALGELTTLPQTPSRLVRGRPLPIPLPLDAFGISILGTFGALLLDAFSISIRAKLASAP